MIEDKTLSTIQFRQKFHHRLFAGSSYDLIPRNSLDKFEKILSVYMCEEEAKSLSKIIIQNQSELLYRILLINLVTEEKEVLHTVVIRVWNGLKVFFYDVKGRRYNDWYDYLSNNQLPEGLMVFPLHGTYDLKNGDVQLDIRKSPAGKTGVKLANCLYNISEIVSVVAVTLPLFSFAKPYTRPINVASALSNGYKVGYHSYKLNDRYKYGQSINFSDKDASLHWSHIGNASLCFMITCYKNKYGNSSFECDIKNLDIIYSMIKKHINTPGALKVFKKKVLAEHMLNFNPELFIKHSNIDVEAAVRTLKAYCGIDLLSPFRKLVDDESLLKVLKDMEICQNINGTLTKLYNLVEEKEKLVVSKILEEAKSWKLNQISDNQFQFRISNICQFNQRAYETLEELCQVFRVDDLKHLLINNVPIFKNIGRNAGKLEELILNSSKQFPQLLSYAVEYASTNNPVDWDQFKPYFIEKLSDSSSELMDCRRNINWVDSIKGEEVSDCNVNNSVLFVRPSRNILINSQDLINLGKRILGVLSLSSVDIMIANKECKWTILVSKKKNRIICISPKIEVKESALDGHYNVFVNSL